MIIIVIAGYLMFLRPSTVEAKISSSSTKVTVAEEITFSAEGSSSSAGIRSYTWDLGDGSPKVVGRTVTHLYVEEGEFIVALMVKDRAGNTDKATQLVNVEGLTVTVPAGYLNDRSEYDVLARVATQNYNDGLFIYKNAPIPYVDTVTVQKVIVDLSGTMVTDEEMVVDAADGMGTIHRCVQRHTVQDLEIDGEVVTDLANLDVTGTIDTSEDIHIATTSGHVIQSMSVTDTVIDPVTFEGLALTQETTAHDETTVFGDLTDLDGQFSIRDIYSGRTFKSTAPSSNSGSMTKGDVTYTWRDDGVEGVNGRPSIKLNVTVDGATMARLGVDELFIDVYVADNLPVHTKLHNHIHAKDGNNVMMSEYTATMTGFMRGIQPASDVDTGAFLNMSLIAETAPLNITPLLGNPAQSSIVFTPREAVQVARETSTQNFATFIKDPEVYLVEGNYSADPDPRWNMTFARPQSQQGFNIIVTMTSAGPNATYELVEETVDIEPVGATRSEIGAVLNLSSAERIIGSDPTVRENMFMNGSLVMADTYILVDAETPVPLADLTLSTIATGTVDYSYSFVHSGSGDFGDDLFSVGVNARNGQIAFMTEHAGQNLPGLT